MTSSAIPPTAGSPYSYVHATASRPLVGETIHRWFDRLAASAPDRTALVSRHQAVRWTRSELVERAEAFGAGLVALGLEPGDRIAVWAQNRAEWTVTQLAASKAGLILVNLNPAARKGEAQRFLDLVGAKALVVQDRFKSSDYVGMIRELAPEIDQASPGELESDAVPSLRLVVGIRTTDEDGGAPFPSGILDFEAVPASASATDRERLAEIAARVRFDDPVNVQFSNATGGPPAGATLTHHNLLNNGLTVGETLRLTEGDLVCVPLPLFHSFGMVVGNVACFASGATVVYPSETFEPAATLEAIAAEGCTAVYGVPAMFIAMLEEESFDSHDLSSLRTGIMGGAPCPIETMKQVVAEMHMDEVTIGYGMTETSPITFMSDIGDPVERRVSTVGTARPHTEAKVVDETGAVVPRGTSGELCIRGYSLMRGYWNDPDLTAQVIDREGWLHTGDLARMDDDGYLSIVGGVKDLIIRGGENISPGEVEEFLAGNPAVAEVVVVGVPDRKLGEEVCACVRVEPGASLTEDELRDYCRGEIAHQKIPRYVRFYEAFPGSTGRALKFLLRKEAMSELGLEETETA